jgi:outer membrane biosynthesis protein TonB
VQGAAGGGVRGARAARAQKPSKKGAGVAEAEAACPASAITREYFSGHGEPVICVPDPNSEPEPDPDPDSDPDPDPDPNPNPTPTPTPKPSPNPGLKVICVGFVENSSLMVSLDRGDQLLLYPYPYPYP